MVYNSFLLSQSELQAVQNIIFLFFVKLWLILSQSELSRLELPKCSSSILMENYNLFCFINSFLCVLANKAWFYEKFIFVIETSYSFKITCILVRQLIPLKENGGVLSKIYYLISWSSICTHLILVSASVKMTGTSTTVI